MLFSVANNRLSWHNQPEAASRFLFYDREKRTTMGNSFANIGSVLGLAVMAFLYSACSKDDTVVNNDQIVGSGRIVSQVRPVGTFAEIQVTNFAKVYVAQDTVEALRIESDDNIIDRVMTSVSNGILVVGLKEGSYNSITVNVFASMKHIRRLESTGAAEFSSTNSVQTDSIICKITGAGSMTLAGTANDEIVEIVGAGNIHNFNLVSTSCYASISGAGNVEINATRSLDAAIAGTGTITYAGNPPAVHQVVTGVGSVRPRP
jgi:hypothetical protein